MLSTSPHKKVIFDSSVWIAFFLESDIFHFDALRCIGGYEKRRYQLCVPTTMIVEIITVLSNKGIAGSKIKKIVDTFYLTANYQVATMPSEELVELALKHATTVHLKALDFHIFLYYVKLKPAKFETYDTKLDLTINKYQYA